MTLEFLARGGEVGARLRSLDWTRTPLGDPSSWPQSLKTIVRVVLDSRYAMWMAWGPELTFFCNDAYLPTVGIRRDWVLGARSDEVWKEIWPDIGPRIERVLRTGEATWDEGLLLYLERSGYPEETYHTFSYSPVYDDENRIAGMLCVVTEVTERVVGERRLRILRELAARAIGDDSVEATCRRAIEVLSGHSLDLPLMALYLQDDESGAAQMVGSTRALTATQLPPVILPDRAEGSWPVGEMMRRGQRLQIDDLRERGLDIPAEIWPEMLQRALIAPICLPGRERPAGFMVMALSPRRPFDQGYVDFIDLVVGQIAAAMAAAQAHAAERARAEALSEIDRAKTTFFSNISHELRTPLTLVLSPIEEALRALPETAPQRRELQIAQRNALRLLKLVNMLLDFSRIEAGRLQARYERTDLATTSAELSSTFRAAMERAGLQLEIDCPLLPAEVYVDREMWEKIVLNLLSNAFKYTLCGTVRVTLREHAGMVSFSVSDSGCGIPADSLPRLFERFYRVPNAGGRSHEGSGIGLALVNELVRLHGGTIGVESTVDIGSTFTVTLPFGSAHLPREQVVGIAAGGREGLPDAQLFLAEAGQWAPAPADAPSVPIRREGTVLLVDDNADMREYLRRLLEGRFEVMMAGDGMEALQQVSERLPDLVLSDVMMPRLDGFGLLQALRSEQRTGAVPVVLVSARAGEEARVEGLHAGADDYLIKPFTARELLARVSTQVSMARLRREAQHAAEESDRRKDEFLAMLAHELRNPLAPIQSANEVLSRILTSNAAAQQFIAIIRRQLKQLSRLVDDLLDVSRITEGRIQLTRQPVELANIVNQAIETVQPQLWEREHQVLVTSAHEPLHVQGDVARLVQCVGNVLGNSAKYTERGGRISVVMRVEGQYGVIEVTDNGAGIAPELLPRLFELFVQGDRTLDRAQGGLGIGLSIVKRLIEMHGGSVAAFSEGAGKGARFEIRLPLSEIPRDTGANIARTPHISRRVLIVDDNADATDSLALMLQMAGNQTRVAYEAETALKMFTHFKPSAVLLDIGLPGMDGYELARRLRALSKEAFLVAITGYGQAQDRERAAAAGCDLHMVKPVDTEELMQELDRGREDSLPMKRPRSTA